MKNVSTDDTEGDYNPPIVRTTSSLKPYQKAYVSLDNSINGSGIYQDAIDKQLLNDSNHSKEEIQNALKTLHQENGIHPNQAIKQHSSLEELIHKANSISDSNE